jgi:hypothetical protein
VVALDGVADIVFEMATDGAVALGLLFFDSAPVVQRGGRGGGAVIGG